MAISSDFSNQSNLAFWSMTTPGGSSASWGGSATDGFLILDTPNGTFDAWNVNGTPRAMQAVADEDFAFTSRFLTVPNEQYEMQGLLVEQDANNWLRFDTYSDGEALYAFAAVTINGSSTAKFQVQIPEGTAPYLRIERSNDTWTCLYSIDNKTWTVAGSFVQALDVTQAGVFAGNLAGSDGFAAQVDWIAFDTDPLLDEDSTFVAPDMPPVAGDDTLTTAADTVLNFDADDLLANDSDPEASALSITQIGTAQSGSLTDNGDGTYTYVPNAGFVGVDTLNYVVSDGTNQTTAIVEITVGDVPNDFGNSDDFSDLVLAGFWAATTPGSGDVTSYANGAESAVALTASGAQDPWGQNMATRLTQVIENVEFSVTTRFLSNPDTKYETQGLIVEQDAGIWLRFDTFFDGSQLRAFAALTVAGKSTALLNVVMPVNAAPYLRLSRTDDNWEFEYSQDGNTWAVAGTVSAAINMSSIGVMAGNVATNNSFTALVDWFEVETDPLTHEDGVPVGQSPPQATDDFFATGVDAVLAVDAGNGVLANDVDPDGEPISASLITGPQHGTLGFNADGSFGYTPDAGFEGTDSFVYAVTDQGGATDEGNVSLTVGTPSNGYSDDFSDAILSGFWTAEGPTGTFAERGITGNDGVLELHSGDGTFDAYGNNTTGRLMQDLLDQDVQFEARFLSVPTGPYQMQGFLFEQDPGIWVRLDAYSAQNGIHLYGGSTVGGTTSARFDIIVDPAMIEYLRASREGDTWTLEYSADGSNWSVAGSFGFAMDLNSGGLFAGNVGASTGFTALVDWFEVETDPITNEDGSVHPLAVADTLFGSPNMTTIINVASDLLANDQTVDSPPALLSVGTPTSGNLTDNGDGTLSFTPDADFEGDVTISYVMGAGGQTDTGELTLIVGTPIDVWGGTEQSFGGNGQGQEFINILGNVNGVVTDLSYTLNGGPVRVLSIGSDTRRLHEAGDFNIDITYSALDGSAVDDIVTITATTETGQIFTQDVTIGYVDGIAWDPNYTIDWSEVAKVSDVVQIADGRWEIGADGLRPTQLGYDRVVVMGDTGWDNFQLTTTITMHDLLNIDPLGRDGGGFAIGMLWTGHTNDPVSGFQPLSGWEPGAAFFYTDPDGNGVGQLDLHPSIDFFSELNSMALDLDEGVAYNFTVQVEQVGLYDRLFSIRIWEEGTSEPGGWTMQGVQTFDITDAPQTGAVYLNAHYFDVSFGDVTVQEITGSDILQGGTGDDYLMGVDAGAALPGQGEVDVAAGYDGVDAFVLGDANGVFYDDGIATAAGIDDFMYAWDFSKTEDILHLHGSASDYSVEIDSSALPEGAAIWLTGDNGVSDELIGILGGLDTFDLYAENVQYFDLFV